MFLVYNFKANMQTLISYLRVSSLTCLEQLGIFLFISPLCFARCIIISCKVSFQHVKYAVSQCVLVWISISVTLANCLLFWIFFLFTDAFCRSILRMNVCKSFWNCQVPHTVSNMYFYFSTQLQSCWMNLADCHKRTHFYLQFLIFVNIEENCI